MVAVCDVEWRRCVVFLIRFWLGVGMWLLSEAPVCCERCSSSLLFSETALAYDPFAVHNLRQI